MVLMNNTPFNLFKGHDYCMYPFFIIYTYDAAVVELVDTPDLGSVHFVREGSSPFRGTILFMVTSKRNNKIFKEIPIIDMFALISIEKDQIY